MTTTLLVMGATWLLVTALGWIVTGLVDAPRRDVLRPVSPIVGLVAAIVVLRWTSVGVGVDVGVWILLGAAVVAAVVATVRDRKWWLCSLRALAWTVGVGAAAVIPAVITFGPTHAVGDSRVVQPSANNDAFYYVAIADWLSEHPATDVPLVSPSPAVSPTPPSYFPARSQLVAHLRIGQELVQAGVDVVIDHPAVDTWYPLTSLWILLLPTAGYGVAVALRIRRWAGVGAGLATSISAVTILQLANQNSDALFGVLVMPFAAAAVVSSLGAKPPVPRWLAAIALVAAVGSYTEYLPLVGPALVVALLIRPPRSLLAALKRLPLLLAVAAVAGPFIWYDAVRSLIYLGGVANGVSVFDGVGSGAILNRFLGTNGVTAPFTAEPMTPVLVAVLAVGVLAALVASRRRPYLLVLAVWPPLLAYYLVELAARHSGYTQQRVVGLYVPLLMFVTAYGYDRLADVVARFTAERPDALRRGLQGVVAAVAVLGLLAFGLVNARADRRQQLTAVALRRHVDPSFSDAASWVRELGGPDGRDVDVLVAEFFDQLWLTDALRREEDTQYPILYTSYMGCNSYWSKSVRRYLLVDRSTFVDADQALVVRSNPRFELLDLSKGPLVAVQQGDEFNNGNWFVLGNSDARRTVTLRGVVRPDDKPHPPRRAPTGARLAPGALTTTTTEITVAVQPGGGRLYNLRQGGLEFVPRQIVPNGDPS